MALVSSKSAGVNRWELVVEVKGETYTEALNKAVKKVSREIQVRGFRKGKVPRHMIEKLYGPSIFYEEAVNQVYPYAYSEAVKEAGIEPVDAADIELVDVDDNGLTFKATVTTKPVPELGAYKGISAVKRTAVIDEADVDREIANMRERYARLVPVEGRKTQKGDTAMIDFEGFVDGVAFEGGKGENYALELGSHTFIEGFEEQVENRDVDEAFDVNVTFPEDYGEASLAGKPAVFKCKVNAIRVRELPELDDEFAKDISEFDTFAEYREDLKAKLQKNGEEQADAQFENELLRQVVEQMQVELPECMIQNGINECLNEYAGRLGQQGITLDDFIRYTGQTREQLSESFRPRAIQQVKSRLALEKIAELEALEPDEKDIDEQYQKLAENYHVEVENLRKYLPLDEIKSDLLCRKALSFIVENATALDAPAEEPAAEEAAEATAEEEKPAKKTARRAVKKTAETDAEQPAEEEKPAKKTARRTAKKAAEPAETAEAAEPAKKPAKRTVKKAAETAEE